MPNDYIPPVIPQAPEPVPLPAGFTDTEWYRWADRVRLITSRLDLLSLDYERWHLQQHREKSVALTEASTAAQAARAAAEERVAQAGFAAAEAQRAMVQALASPAPPLSRTAFMQQAVLAMLHTDAALAPGVALVRAEAMWQAVQPADPPVVIFFPDE